MLTMPTTGQSLRSTSQRLSPRTTTRPSLSEPLTPRNTTSHSLGRGMQPYKSATAIISSSPPPTMCLPSQQNILRVIRVFRILRFPPSTTRAITRPRRNSGTTGGNQVPSSISRSAPTPAPRNWSVASCSRSISLRLIVPTTCPLKRPVSPITPGSVVLTWK